VEDAEKDPEEEEAISADVANAKDDFFVRLNLARNLRLTMADPGPELPELKVLNTIEKRLIAPINVVVDLVRCANGASTVIHGVVVSV
jgi:hypothetical protein